MAGTPCKSLGHFTLEAPSVAERNFKKLTNADPFGCHIIQEPWAPDRAPESVPIRNVLLEKACLVLFFTSIYV